MSESAQKVSSRNSLNADKELFRLWYEFYRLALTSTDKEVVRSLKRSSDFYREWEVNLNEKFDAWWTSHRHLFERTGWVQIINIGEPIPSNALLLSVPLSSPRTLVLREIRALLSNLVTTNSAKSFGGSKYQPSEIRGVKRDSLRIMLDLERRVFRNEKLKGEKLRERVLQFFSEERYQRKKNGVPASFLVSNHKRHGDTSDNVDRNIRRYRQKVKKLILNVARGEFPGRY